MAETNRLINELTRESVKDPVYLTKPGAFFTILAQIGAEGTSDSTAGKLSPPAGSSGKSTPLEKSSA